MNTKLLSQYLQIRSSKNNIIGLSFQDLMKQKSKCQLGYFSHLELWVLIKFHSDEWQNSVPCGISTEIPILLPFGSQRILEASFRSQPWGLLHRQFTTYMIICFLSGLQEIFSMIPHRHLRLKISPGQVRAILKVNGLVT